MRHRAMFHTNLTAEAICTWFITELNKLGFLMDGAVKQTKYDRSFSVSHDKQTLSFSVFEVPASEANICIYVEPKLGFFDAILKKPDVLRELATTHLHTILSSSDSISKLGWYTDTQVWKGATDAP